MPDYPTTRAECLALSQYGQAVNCIFDIYQVKENMDGTAPTDLTQVDEVQVSEEEAEAQYFQEAIDKIASIKNAMTSSAKSAPLRDGAIFRVPFCNAEAIEFKNTEDGDQERETIPAEQGFMNTFVPNYLEKYAAFFVNYAKFKKRVDMHTLFPDKGVMAELAELRDACAKYTIWREEREQSRKEKLAQKEAEAAQEGTSQEQVEEV